MTPLCLLAKKYGTDKYRAHAYTPIYYRLLGERAATIKRVLEIGIGKGRGLRMWRDFFPAAEIVGVDIDRDKLIDEPRIKSYVADQASPAEMTAIARTVAADRATFARSAGDYDELIDMETGRVIGFNWPIDLRPTIKPPCSTS
jgi:hypothetical protein